MKYSLRALESGLAITKWQGESRQHLGYKLGDLIKFAQEIYQMFISAKNVKKIVSIIYL